MWSDDFFVILHTNYKKSTQLRKSYKFCWNHVWILLFTIGFGIFFLVTPKYLDDLWYMEFTYDWYERQGIWNPDEGGNIITYGVPWEGIGEIIDFHYTQDNVRVCNMVGPFMLLFPKWAGSIFALIALLYTVWSAFRLTGINIRKSWLVGFGLALWVITPLWYHAMGTVIFQYNYVLSGGFCIWMLMMIRRPGTTVASYIGFILLSAIVGVWHEGFTLPMLVGLSLMLICFKDWRTRYVVTGVVILALGMVYHLSGASTIERTGLGYYSINIKRVIHSVWYHRALWIVVVVSIIYVFKFGVKRFFCDRLLVFMLSSSVTAFGLAYYTQIERAAWWGDMASIIMTLQMLREMDVKTIGYRGWRLVLAGISMLWGGFQLAAVDVYTIRYAREYPQIIKKFLDEPNDSYFSSLTDYPWIGIWFMQFYDHHKFAWPEFPKQFYWGLFTERNFLNVVPEGLRNVRLEDAEKLEGNLGMYKYGRYVIAPTDSLDRYWLSDVAIDYGWFKVDDRYVDFIPFVSEADGRRYVYMMTVYNTTEYQLGNIKGVSQTKKGE